MHPLRKVFLNLPVVSRFYVRNKIAPSVYIVGFQKCGTTTLYNYLVNQPGFVEGKRKEVDSLTDPEFSESVYLWHYPWLSKNQKVINASHMSSYNPIGLARLKEFYPGAKIIAIVRNPVDRAFSHYWYDKESKFSKRRTMIVPESFEEYIDVELGLLQEVDDFNDLEALHSITSRINDYGTPCVRGLYFYYLSRMKNLDIMPMVVSLDDLKDKREAVLDSIFDFLEIPLNNRVYPNKIIYNKGLERKNSMSISTRQRLLNFFEPHNKKLYNLLGTSFNWE